MDVGRKAALAFRMQHRAPQQVAAAAAAGQPLIPSMLQPTIPTPDQLDTQPAGTAEQAAATAAAASKDMPAAADGGLEILAETAAEGAVWTPSLYGYEISFSADLVPAAVPNRGYRPSRSSSSSDATDRMSILQQLAGRDRKPNTRKSMVAATAAAAGLPVSRTFSSSHTSSSNSNSSNNPDGYYNSPQNYRLRLIRVLKALLGKRGELVYNTTAAVGFGNRSGGINESGCKVILTCLFGPEYDSNGRVNSRWPKREELSNQGLVQFVGRLLSNLTGGFVPPAAVVECYVTKKVQQSYTVSDNWLKKKGLCPWSWRLPIPEGPVNDPANTPPRSSVLSEADIHAVEDAVIAAIATVKPADLTATVEQLNTALVDLRAMMAGSSVRVLNRPRVRREKLQACVLAVLRRSAAAAAATAAAAVAAAE